MKKILIDTNILISYSKGFKREFKQLLIDQENNKSELYINPIIISEFLNDKKLKNKTNLIKANELLSLFSLANINKETGILAGLLLREDKIVFIADAFIAATCIQFNLALYTDNKKHFRNIKNLNLFTS
ncbi:hypothetical protein A2954_05355 [Candidatus Roizmanbacteria bacterium RIFCSPLOWO2_01_FULL_37_12]|uniref:PIN domain-containing protein n=1 Tax=Candidatus Roizmanbacteria bacterium RIFCSPLOWO2_01_FULL_37_12 TaxID=1802056 RepID=A0A1F7IDE0_9BACT|nr:MAG: hypothetical protein A2768_00205 [Candidatus Roizmanbacteria bacterium RIFCSPHIGHO2_01_FULL_37_16]OGK26449.1 MAG: hypothetical protein A3D76_02980 [Candidatus Roizmanbacteria bacterium RIFCSPHIGHO2_02_FULL_37_9b]OGK41384.1 MAG: hypothetical protein A2954_05355 [Candidatus Roizmanbacteria bacterium RIFCSPLOWO2_01_FULL_37_12]